MGTYWALCFLCAARVVMVAAGVNDCSVVRRDNNPKASAAEIIPTGDCVGYVTVADLGLKEMADCLDRYFGQTIIEGYSVEADKVHLEVNMTTLFGTNNTAVADCDQNVTRTSSTMHYVTLANGMALDRLRQVQSSVSDTTRVGTNYILAPQLEGDGTGSEAKNATMERMRRRDNMQADFSDYGGWKGELWCNTQTEKCTNRGCFSSGYVEDSAWVSGINWMGAWSHHHCQYKQYDNWYGVVQVFHKDYWYRLTAPSPRKVYSTTMTPGTIGYNWGASSGNKENLWC